MNPAYYKCSGFGKYNIPDYQLKLTNGSASRDIAKRRNGPPLGLVFNLSKVSWVVFDIRPRAV
jgi:hypothetical protein